MAVHNEYPATRYHATEEPRVVRSKAADDALGPGWFDSPKKAAPVTAKKAGAPAKP